MSELSVCLHVPSSYVSNSCNFLIVKYNPSKIMFKFKMLNFPNQWVNCMFSPNVIIFYIREILKFMPDRSYPTVRLLNLNLSLMIFMISSYIHCHWVLTPAPFSFLVSYNQYFSHCLLLLKKERNRKRSLDCY